MQDAYISLQYFHVRNEAWLEEENGITSMRIKNI